MPTPSLPIPSTHPPTQTPLILREGTLLCEMSKALPTISSLSKVYIRREQDPKKPVHVLCL